ncbi:MAG: nicotinate phosphoribosyltransferase [Candidatus Paceibacterota bacterium]
MIRKKNRYYNIRERSGSPFREDFYHEVMFLGLVNLGMAKNRAGYYHNIRSIPVEMEGGYLLTSGTNFMLSHLANLSFEKNEINAAVKFARKQNLKVTDDFINYMKDFTFNADVYVVPEGQIVGPGEPIVKVTGSAIEALMVETSIISTITYATLVATRASRVVMAADGKLVFEYGYRRSPNPLISTWASMVGGCAGTSNVLAGKLFNIPLSGTMAHAWVMMFKNEYEAFLKFYEATGSNIFLIDTYDPIRGAQIAIEVAKKIGKKVKVRLDSGDPVVLVPMIMQLNTEGWIEGIIISDDMNVQKINRIRKSGIPVMAFGVGTYIVVVPSASSVYKLTRIKDEGMKEYLPTIKVSSSNPAKSTLPGDFIVWRREVDGKILGDIVALSDEERPGKEYTEVMVRAMKGGRLTHKLPKLSEIMEFAKMNLAKLTEPHARIEKYEQYPVRISDKLMQLKQELIANRMTI